MRTLRATVLTAGILLLSCNLWANPELAAKVMLSIEAQPLTKALNQWAEQTGMMAMVASEGEAGTLMAPSVVGEFTPEEALGKLLGKTQFTYQFVSPTTVAI